MRKINKTKSDKIHCDSLFILKLFGNKQQLFPFLLLFKIFYLLFNTLQPLQLIDSQLFKAPIYE